jgi:precorrin-2/cobalt-factor-2 C20-methyltransferase
MFGTLFGVGVGPGDPQLMTFKAADILKDVPVIAYVVDDKGDSFARQAAAARIPPSAMELPLHFSMSPQRERRLSARQNAASLVSEQLLLGKDVAFITEGDPLLYSTFQHLLLAMPPEVRVEICPGVSSFTAAAAAAQFPLAIENQRMVIAATDEDTVSQLANWLPQFEVIVLFKVHRRIKEIASVLRQAGALSQAVLVQHASSADPSAVTNLADWDGSELPYFSILLIRSQVRLSV